MTHATRSGPRSEPNRLQSVAAVAERLGVSTKSVRRMIEQNVLRHHRIGRLIRFTEDDIATFINARRK